MRYEKKTKEPTLFKVKLFRVPHTMMPVSKLEVKMVVKGDILLL